VRAPPVGLRATYEALARRAWSTGYLASAMKPVALLPVLLAANLLAQAPPPLPVREVTVFKDGHAYLIRETSLAAADGGRVVLDELPVPVLGTFWPYATGGAKLIAARAGTDTVTEAKTAIDLRQIARANVGKDVVVVDQSQVRIEGKLLAVPARPGDDAGGGDLLLIATAAGTRALPFALVRDLEVKGEFAATLPVEQQRQRLVLSVEGGGPDAKVGVMYVQHGLRWIPAYRIDIDGKGKASVQMEATLVNDLVDLEQATVNLVIGVPKFAFAELRDPISLQQEVAEVAARAYANPQLANFLSNSLMTQAGAYRADGPAQEPAPAVEGGAANEDLFVFTLRQVTLKKGERMVLPIRTFDLSYRDVYTLTVPFAPPMELRQNLQGSQVIELARELAAPKAMHVLRLKNASTAPLTTAPALVLADGRVLAQGRLRYTPIGVETDLEINAAIDICVTSQETETGRQDHVTRADGTYGRIELAGSIELRNEKPGAVEIEVRRRILGLVDDVAQEGEKTQLDLVQLWSDTDRPTWWASWGWPHWWFRWNGFGEFRWTVTLAPGASTKLESSWHYFWR